MDTFVPQHYIQARLVFAKCEPPDPDTVRSNPNRAIDELRYLVDKYPSGYEGYEDREQNDDHTHMSMHGNIDDLDDFETEEPMPGMPQIAS